MAIAYGAAGSNVVKTTAATAWAVPYPASVAANDILVLLMRTGGGTVTDPAGWTKIYSETAVINPRGGVWIKRAVGGETGTLAVTTVSTTGVGVMLRYTGVDTTTAIDVAAVSSSSNAVPASNVITMPDITTVTADAWLVAAVGSNSTSVQHQFSLGGGADWTPERVEFTATVPGPTASAFAGALADQPAGTAGAKSVTITQGTATSSARAYWAVVMALRPAASGGTAVTATATGIGSGEAFGTATANVAGLPQPTGIPSAEAFGTPIRQAFLFTDFDDGTAQGWTASTAGAGSMSVTASAAHDGSYGAASDVPAATVDRAGYTRSIEPAQQVTIRGWWKVTTEGASTTSNVPFARLFNGTQRLADVYRQNGQAAGAANVWLRVVKAIGGSNYYFIGTGYSLPLNTWVYVSFTWGLDGKPEVYINGTRYLSAANQPADWFAAPEISTAWLGSQEAGNQGAWNIDTVNVISSGPASTGEFRPLPTLTGEAFGTPAMSGALTASPGGAASGEAFGTPTSGGVITAAPSGIGSGEAFGTAANNGLLTGSPGGIASAEAFGTPTATVLTNNQLPVGIPSAEAFGTATATGQLTATATGIATAQAFGTATATGQLTAAATGIGSAEAFGTPNAGTAAGPAGIGSAEAFGTPVVVLSAQLLPTGVPSAEAFGASVMGGNLATSPGGIASAEAFGTPAAFVLAGGQLLLPTGIGSAEAFGTPAMGGTYTASSAGIGSAQAFGTVMNLGLLTASPTSFADPDGFGTPSWSGLWIMQPAGIPSAESVSNASNGSTYTATATGIGSGEAFGAPVELSVLLLAPVTIATLEAFGVPVETGSLAAGAVGIGSAQAMGFPILTVSLTATAVGISDPNGYGTPTATVLAFIGRDIELLLEPLPERWHVRANYGGRFNMVPAPSRFDTEEKPERFGLVPAAARFDTEGGL